MDGKAIGLELRAAGSEAAFRDRARLMALEPPPALTDFLAAVTDSETLRQVLLEDAVVWAFCRNPKKGLALLASLADREEIASLTQKVLRFFPPKDLPVVLAWYEKLPEGKLKTEALGTMLPVLTRVDFERAAALILAMPSDSALAAADRFKLLHNLIFKQGLDALQFGSLLPGLSGEDLGTLIFVQEQQRFAKLQHYEVEQALEMLTGPDGAGLGISLENFFTGWAHSDPIRAAKALENLKPEEVRPQVYHQFTAKWADGNAGAASEWVKQLPPGRLKQGAVSGLVMSLSEEFPVEAVIWAGTLTDSAERLAELKRVIEGRTGPVAEALKVAVDGLNLNPQEREELNLSTSP